MSIQPIDLSQKLQAARHHLTAGNSREAARLCAEALEVAPANAEANHLSGHTTGNRLLVFAGKPAPVQITWLGYANTTGLPAMDYPYIKNRYLSLFAEHSIEPERIEIVAGLSRTDFLEIHNRIDICLDPFPFNGLFTTCDSLWMGVPVITLRGDRYAGRMASSALTCLGLQELIADSMEEYLEKAVILAGSHENLAALRHTLRDGMRRSPICDAEVFAQSVEKAYSNMWKAYVSKIS